jgi:hypothetical protein
VQTLLEIVASNCALWVEFRPAYSVSDMLQLRLDALELEAEENGGAKQVNADNGAKQHESCQHRAGVGQAPSLEGATMRPMGMFGGGGRYASETATR